MHNFELKHATVGGITVNNYMFRICLSVMLTLSTGIQAAPSTGQMAVVAVFALQQRRRSRAPVPAQLTQALQPQAAQLTEALQPQAAKLTKSVLTKISHFVHSKTGIYVAGGISLAALTGTLCWWLSGNKQPAAHTFSPHTAAFTRVCIAKLHLQDLLRQNLTSAQIESIKQLIECCNSFFATREALPQAGALELADGLWSDVMDRVNHTRG